MVSGRAELGAGVRAVEWGYLAHKGHQLSTRGALVWAQPELRVVIRSHRELDVS